MVYILFYYYSKGEVGRMSVTGAAVLLKFNLLQSLGNYIKSVYYSNFPMTL